MPIEPVETSAVEDAKIQITLLERIVGESATELTLWNILYAQYAIHTSL